MQYPPDIYISPGFAIKRMMGFRQKYGNTRALTDGSFQKEREMWIAGVFLLDMERITKKEYWLKPVQNSGTPDILALHLFPSEIGATAEFQEIEIFEYESHFKGSLIDAIKSKLSRKSYPENYILLGYFHHRPGEVFKPYEISQQVHSLSPNLSQIWILGSIQSKVPHTYTVVQLYPKNIYHNFDYMADFSATKQHELIRAKRDLTRKTNRIEFEPLGRFILPLP